MPVKTSTYHGSRVCSVVWRLAIFPVHRHRRRGDGPHPFPDLRLGQLECGESVGVMPAAHMAYLVRAKLERRYPATNECRQEIVTRQALLLEIDNLDIDLVDLGIGVLRVKLPVNFLGNAQGEYRQPNLIGSCHALDVEIAMDPAPT